MSPKTFVCAGEFRSDLLKIFNPPEETNVLVAAPGYIVNFKGLSAIHSHPDKHIARADSYSFRYALLKALAWEIDSLPQTEEWETIIQRWCAALESKQAQCFHHMKRPLYTRLISKSESTVLCPGPITVASIQQERELNVELRDTEHQKARQWFEQQLIDSEDISGDLRKLLLDSWAGLPVSPTELYYKVLSQYFWLTIEELDFKADDNPLLEQLTEFQIEAYQYAKGILRRYGGVFLADVVGLGKTFIALALLRHLQDRYGEYAVVVAPPHILPAWTTLAAQFKVELQTVSIGKLEDLNSFQDREVLVIDESHHFRNIGTQRYERIQEWLRPSEASSQRKVLLLSATPQNNHPDDVKHQLAFFPDNYARLPFHGESLDAWFSQVQNGQASLTELLQHVVVRRTRRFIKSAYPNATLRIRTKEGGYEHVPLQFPERRSGEDQCLRYSINEMYGGDLYQDIIRVLAGLSYAPYCLADYLMEESYSDHRVVGIRRAGSSVRGLYKVLLLKRLESSCIAFLNTLRRLLFRLDNCLKHLDQGVVVVRIMEHTISATEDGSPDLTADERSVPSTLFSEDRLRADLLADRDAVRTLRSRVENVDQRGDRKVSRLCEYLEQRNPENHRTIVFTQFADTAEYLGKSLEQRFGKTEVVTGSRGNAMAFARRFSPVSNQANIPDHDQIDLLISTDALSEGVNLQDADTLVNYDIHWNPVRLIQRAGRIDRIGSEYEVIHVASFLPESALDTALGLETVLRKRIKEFLEVFGEDSSILPSDEKLDPDAAMSAFTGAALEQEDDDLDGLSRHVERLLLLRRENPKLYERIIELRPGRHAVSISQHPQAGASRLGWFWRFWVQDNEETIRNVDDLRGLDTLYAHSKSEEYTSPPAMIRRQLGEFIGNIRKEFEPLAEAFREQRMLPRLSPPENFILERLETYKRLCIASRHQLLGELIDWVRSGYSQALFRRYGRIWKKESLPAEIVFNEVRMLSTRITPVQEELGKPEVIGAVTGINSNQEP